MGLAWTSERPTRPGWYWWRGEKKWYAGKDHHPPPIILALVSCDNETLSIYKGSIQVQHPFMDYTDDLSDWVGEWYGPLETP